MAGTRQHAHPRLACPRLRAAGVPGLFILGYAVAVYVMFLALLGNASEEHDARRDLGESYHPYQRRVPALMPALWPRSRRGTPSQGEDTA